MGEAGEVKTPLQGGLGDEVRVLLRPKVHLDVTCCGRLRMDRGRRSEWEDARTDPRLVR